MGSNRLKLFIRTDANASIATGHLYRCMAIAEAACRLRTSASSDISDDVSEGEACCEIDGLVEGEACCETAGLAQSEACCETDILAEGEACCETDGVVESEACCETNGLAESEAQRLFDVEFIFGENVSMSFNAGVMSTRMLSSYKSTDMEAELPEMIEILKACDKEQKPILLIDSYNVTERYLRELSKYAYIAYIDDLRQLDFGYDLIINYDYVNKENILSYEESYSKAKKKLLGLAYTPLREQFAMTKRSVAGVWGRERVASPIKNVMIASGGSDPEHALLRISEVLMDIPNLQIHLLVGKLCNDRKEILELSEKNPKISVHENVTDMAGLLTRMDMAVSAAGTTLYELCACSVATISYSFADNQIPGALAFDKSGVIPYAGDLRKESVSLTSGESTAPLSVIKQFIEGLDGERALAQASAMHSLIDGHGSERIAKELASIVE